MRQLSIPDIEGLQVPDLPMPWSRLERTRIISNIVPRDQMWDVVAAGRGLELNDFRRTLEAHFLMDIDGSEAVRGAVERLMPEAEERYMLFSAITADEHTSMLQEFEHDILGLEPTGSSDGLRYRESAAGFAYAVYPAAPVAGLFGISGSVLLEHLHERHPIIARAGEFILTMLDNSRTAPETVMAAEIEKLTLHGQRFVDSVLVGYEHGLKAAEAQA